MPHTLMTSARKDILNKNFCRRQHQESRVEGLKNEVESLLAVVEGLLHGRELLKSSQAAARSVKAQIATKIAD